MNFRFRFTGVLAVMFALCANAFPQHVRAVSGDEVPRLTAQAGVGSSIGTREKIPPLMRIVSLRYVDRPLDQVLAGIMDQADVRISYSHDIIPASRLVSLDLQDVTVAEALVAVLRGTNAMLSISTSGQIALVPRGRIEQETGVVMGRVLEARTNKPLPGANILIEGTTLGAAADADGNYRIERVPPGTYKLRASVVGFQSVSQEITVIAGQVVTADFFLEETVIGLDEVVVIGYGTTTKRFSTSNISTVTAQDIAKQPVGNPLLSLQANVPGLVVTQGSGFPGSAVKVQVQGRGSLSATVGNDPLYIVDGVPYPSQSLYTLSRVQGDPGNSATDAGGVQSGSTSPLSFINPAEIDRIDILKDADATAIYGSRAAHGAILITTKKGTVGEMRIGVNIQKGWGTVGNRMELLNTEQYLEMRREAFANTGGSPGATDYDLNGMWDTTRSVDWQEELIGGTAHYDDHQVSISGGSVNTQYFVLGGYRRESTVFRSDFADQRGSLRLNLHTASPDQKLRMQFSGSYLVGENTLPAVDYTATAMQLPPLAPTLYNADGTLNWAPDGTGTPTWHNPLAMLKERFNQNTNNLIANISASYAVLPGLEVKSSFGFNSLKSHEEKLTPREAINPGLWAFFPRSSQFLNGDISSWIVEPQATYRQSFGDFVIEGLVGMTIHESSSLLEAAFGDGYTSDLDLENLSLAPNKSSLRSVSLYRYNAGFARVNVNWVEKYIFNLSGRRDGSSRFGPKSRFHNFGSVGFAWVFTNESFLEDYLSFLSFGKLMASYGTTGNDQIGNYNFQSLYNNVFSPISYQGAVGLAPSGIHNPYLEWEETNKLHFGMNIGLLDGMVLLDFSYYRNRTSNQLLPYALPITTGFANLQRNFPATVENSGWEFAVSARNVSFGDFSWRSSFTFTVPRNKLVDFPDLETSTYANSLIIGLPIHIVKRFKSAGVDPATGLYQFVAKDGSITTNPDFNNDRTELVDTSPEYFGGFQNTISYKGFELDFLIQFVKQLGLNYLHGDPTTVHPGSFYGQFNFGNQPVYILDRWRQQGDIATIARFGESSDFQVLLNRILYLSFSDAVVSDASYIRLKNLSLSWHIPDEWGQILGLPGARVYVQGQNLLTFTNYKGLDPETRNTTTLPPLRVWTTGVQLTF